MENRESYRHDLLSGWRTILTLQTTRAMPPPISLAPAWEGGSHRGLKALLRSLRRSSCNTWGFSPTSMLQMVKLAGEARCSLSWSKASQPQPLKAFVAGLVAFMSSCGAVSCSLGRLAAQRQGTQTHHLLPGPLDADVVQGDLAVGFRDSQLKKPASKGLRS